MTIKNHLTLGKKIIQSIFVLTLVFSVSSPLITFAKSEEKIDKPTWISGKLPPQYSQMQYITGVGSAASAEEAEASARRSLAEVVRSQIKSKFTKNSSSDLSESTTGKTEGQDTSSSNSQVEILADVQLQGVQIAETYHDTTEKTFYALAVLDRMKTRTLYATEMAKLRSTIAAKDADFEKTPKISTGQDVLDLVTQYDAKNSEYAFFNNGQGAPDALTAAQVEAIRNKIAEATQEKSISVQLTGDYDEFNDIFSACLTSKSLQVVETGNNAAAAKYIVKGKIVAKEQTINVDGWVKYQFLATADILSGGTSLGHISVTKIVTGRSADACFEKVKEALSQDFCDKTFKLTTK